MDKGYQKHDRLWGVMIGKNKENHFLPIVNITER